MILFGLRDKMSEFRCCIFVHLAAKRQILLHALIAPLPWTHAGKENKSADKYTLMKLCFSFLLFSFATSAPSHLDYWQNAVPVCWSVSGGEFLEGGAAPAVWDWSLQHFCWVGFSLFSICLFLQSATLVFTNLSSSWFCKYSLFLSVPGCMYVLQRQDRSETCLQIQNTAAEHLLGYWRTWSLEDAADDETMALWSIHNTEEIPLFWFDSVTRKQVRDSWHADKAQRKLV